MAEGSGAGINKRKLAAEVDAEEDARLRAARRNLLMPLSLLASDFRERIRSGLRERHHQLQPSQSSVIVHLAIDGSRPSELAEKAGMTKQAMGQIIDELEDIGYVEKAADPDDGRAKIVRFTARGLGLLEDSSEIVDQIWRDYTELVGAGHLETLRNELNRLLREVRPRDSSNG